MRLGEKYKDSIGFVFKNKCHPVTQAYADAIGAVPYRITGVLDALWKGLTLPVFQYYFVESVMSMIVPITKRLLGNNVTIIFRGNDGLFGEKTTAYLDTKNVFKKQFLLFLIKHMNGINVESDAQKEEVRQWTDAVVEVSESFVENKKTLEKIKPNLNTKTFLFIGEYRPPYDHKNIELLIKIFKKLPEYKLIIIGKNTKQLQGKAKKNANIEILDFISNKDDFYKKATYYIHLPKYEAGPITLLEAIIAGLIPITNKNAGHHTLIEKVKKDLVLNPNLSEEETRKCIQAIEKLPSF